MTEERLEGHLGRPIAIDLCLSCQSFWFDSSESLQLSPASILTLFRIIGDRAAPPRAGQDTARCPRCSVPLRRVHDQQRSTRFEYLSCPNRHGRLTTFFNFLREKNFVRPLSPEQLNELRANLQSVSCSNCGATIDLATATTCGHCGSALSMLDMTQASHLIAQLKAADRPNQPVDPLLPLHLQRARRDMEWTFGALELESGWMTTASTSGLVGAGLTAIARWLNRDVK